MMMYPHLPGNWRSWWWAAGILELTSPLAMKQNLHHTSWGSTNTNRGESLFNYIMANGLDIMNSSKRPNFVTSNRQEVINITIAILYTGNLIKDWHVTEEASCSDHRYVHFTINGHQPISWNFSQSTHNQPAVLQNWPVRLPACVARQNSFTDLEIAAKQFQDATVLAYNENCPLTVRRNNRNISWWNQCLAEKRRKVHKLFNVAKKSGNWTDYKRNLTDYNKTLRQAKRESWRRHCEEIQKTPECARLHKILSKDVQSTISSIQLDNGDYTTTEKGTME